MEDSQGGPGGGRGAPPLVDIGQVEGATTHGSRTSGLQEIKHDPRLGATSLEHLGVRPPLQRTSPKTSGSACLKGQEPNGSDVIEKAIGEPAMLVSIGVLFAIKEALNSARKDAGRIGGRLMDRRQWSTFTRMRALKSTTSYFLVLPTI